MLQNGFELIGRCGEIEQAVAARPALLIDFIKARGQSPVTCRIVEVALMIKDRLRKGVPDFVAHTLARKLADGLLQIAPEFLVAFLSTRKANNDYGGRQIAVRGKATERE